MMETQSLSQVRVANDGNIVFEGAAIDFIRDNDFDEDVIDMVNEACAEGKSERDFLHSGIWTVERV